MDALAAEFTDRFGVLPEMVTNLFYQMQVKLRAERAGLVSVGMESGQIVLRYPASAGRHGIETRLEPAEWPPAGPWPGGARWQECLLVHVWKGCRLADQVVGSAGEIGEI